MAPRQSRRLEASASSPATTSSYLFGGVMLGLIMSQLAVSVGGAIPVLLAILLAADAGGDLFLVSTGAAIVVGAVMCWWIGGAFGRHAGVDRGFAIAPLAFAVYWAVLAITRWEASDVVGRVLSMPYVSGNLALAFGFHLARRRATSGGSAGTDAERPA